MDKPQNGSASRLSIFISGAAPFSLTVPLIGLTPGLVAAAAAAGPPGVPAGDGGGEGAGSSFLVQAANDSKATNAEASTSG